MGHRTATFPRTSKSVSPDGPPSTAVIVAPGAPAPSDVVAHDRAAGWWDDSGLWDGLEVVAEPDGDRLAVVDNQGSWSYQQLREAVEHAVCTLLAAGVEPGDAVVPTQFAPRLRPAD
jgi:non-ribosomal peptide synthetase component E (peptide arylation enzyme)